MVASLATMTHSRPLMRPMPVIDAGGMHVAAVEPVGRERRQLEERRAGIEQQVDALARQQLAARRCAAPAPPRCRPIAASSLSRRSATSAFIAAALAANSSERVSMADWSTVIAACSTSPRLRGEVGEAPKRSEGGEPGEGDSPSTEDAARAPHPKPSPRKSGEREQHRDRGAFSASDHFASTASCRTVRRPISMRRISLVPAPIS